MFCLTFLSDRAHDVAIWCTLSRVRLTLNAAERAMAKAWRQRLARWGDWLDAAQKSSHYRKMSVDFHLHDQLPDHPFGLLTACIGFVGLLFEAIIDRGKNNKNMIHLVRAQDICCLVQSFHFDRVSRTHCHLEHLVWLHQRPSFLLKASCRHRSEKLLDCNP